MVTRTASEKHHGAFEIEARKGVSLFPLQAVQAGPSSLSPGHPAQGLLTFGPSAADLFSFPPLFSSPSSSAWPQPNASKKPQAAPVLPSSHCLQASSDSVIEPPHFRLPPASRLPHPSAAQRSGASTDEGRVVAQRSEAERAHRGG